MSLNGQSEIPISSVPGITNIGNLSGKIALITGGSSGLGRAIASHYAAAGAFIVSADLTPNPPNAPIVAETLKGVDLKTPTVDLLNDKFPVKEGGSKQRAIYVTCDVTKPESVEAAVNKAVETYGRLDVMVNNAGELAISFLSQLAIGFILTVIDDGSRSQRRNYRWKSR